MPAGPIDPEEPGLTLFEQRVDRGVITLQANVTEAVRRNVVVAPSIWWRKLSPDGRNANQLTSQKLTDFGGGATFYDVLVEVDAVDDAS